MKKNIFLIMFIVSLISLDSSDVSIKLEKNFEIKSEGKNYLIARLSSGDIDEKGNSYFVDSIQNSILKFNKNGEFLIKDGRRGEGPGEFPGKPYMIRYSEGKIYISLFLDIYKSKGIFVFTTNLKFLNRIKYNKRINSLYIKDKHLYISNIKTEKAFTFDVLGEYGNYIHDEDLSPILLPTFFKNQKEVIIDKNGNMYIVSTFEDKIEKWNSKHVKIWSKHLFSGQKIKLSKGPTGTPLPLKSFWYKKIAIDNSENMYILSGKIAKHKRRDVYVISKKGKLLTMFTLSHKSSSVFSIDKDNNIYVDDLLNEDVALIRYKLHFDSKRIKLDPKGFPAIKKGSLFYEYINAKK